MGRVYLEFQRRLELTLFRNNSFSPSKMSVQHSSCREEGEHERFRTQ